MTSPPPCGIILEQSARGRQQKVNIAGWSSLVARRAHNPKVVGSNPAPATTKCSEISQNAFFVVCIRYEEGAAAHRFSRKCSSPSYCIKNLHPLAAEMVAANKARTDVNNVSSMGRDGSGIRMMMWAGATMEAGPRAGQAAGINSRPSFPFGGIWPIFGMTASVSSTRPSPATAPWATWI